MDMVIQRSVEETAVTLTRLAVMKREGMRRRRVAVDGSGSSGRGLEGRGMLNSAMKRTLMSALLSFMSLVT